MAVISLAALVVVANQADTRTAVEQRILETVPRRGNRQWNSLNHHFHDCTVVIVKPLVKKELGLHIVMVLQAIWLNIP